MTVVRITEISASSTESFEDAVRVGIADGKATGFRVKLKINFVLE